MRAGRVIEFAQLFSEGDRALGIGEQRPLPPDERDAGVVSQASAARETVFGVRVGERSSGEGVRVLGGEDFEGQLANCGQAIEGNAAEGGGLL